jgi:hypothetical protein
MAQTQAQWKTVLETEKATKSSLDIWVTGANKGWRSWLNVVAYVTNLIDVKWDTQNPILVSKADAVQKHTREWYRQRALAYQDGDTLIVVDNEWTYSVIDEDKQIIVACVVSQDDSDASANEKAVKFHPAILNASGYLEVPTGQFPNRLQIYMRGLAPDGSVVDNLFYTEPVVTNFAVEATIFYDPAIINASGQLVSDTTVFPVVDAIKAYRDEFVNVGGFLRNSTLINYIKAVDGVSAVALIDQKYDTDGGEVYTDVTREFELNLVADYLIDGATSLLTYTSI